MINNFSAHSSLSVPICRPQVSVVCDLTLNAIADIKNSVATVFLVIFVFINIGALIKRF